MGDQGVCHVPTLSIPLTSHGNYRTLYFYEPKILEQTFLLSAQSRIQGLFVYETRL